MLHAVDAFGFSSIISADPHENLFKPSCIWLTPLLQPKKRYKTKRVFILSRATIYISTFDQYDTQENASYVTR